MKTKTCRRCKKRKPVENGFYLKPNGSPISPDCRACYSVRNRRKRKRDRINLRKAVQAERDAGMPGCTLFTISRSLAPGKTRTVRRYVSGGWVDVTEVGVP